MASHLTNNPKWYVDRITKKRKFSCTDYSYTKNNGALLKGFYALCKMLGNGYKGDK